MYLEMLSIKNLKERQWNGLGRISRLSGAQVLPLGYDRMALVILNGGDISDFSLQRLHLSF